MGSEHDLDGWGIYNPAVARVHCEFQECKSESPKRGRSERCRTQKHANQRQRAQTQEHKRLGRHVCRAKLPPKTKLYRYKKWFEKPEKGFDIRSEACPNIFKPLSRRLKISHRHFSKCVFHRPKFAQFVFCTARLCRGSHANKRAQKSTKGCKMSAKERLDVKKNCKQPGWELPRKLYSISSGAPHQP